MPNTVAKKSLLTAYFASIGSYLIAGILVPIVSTPLYPLNVILAPLLAVDALLTLNKLDQTLPFLVAGLMIAGLIWSTHKLPPRSACVIAFCTGAAITWISFYQVTNALEDRMMSSALTLNAECVDVPPLRETLSNASWFDVSYSPMFGQFPA